MLYAIKFIYQWLLPPGCFIIMLALAAWRLRGKWRWALAISAALLLFLSLRIGADALARSLETWYVPPESPQGDVILMLGNGSVAGVPDIDGIGQPSGTMAKSMGTALRLQRATGLPLLVSGGMVFEDSGREAAIALREFRAMGIAPDMLYEENQSRNTVENARLSREILEEHGWSHPLLLVVALQAPRTAMIFQREGIEATIYPTHYRQPGEHHFSVAGDLAPSAGNLETASAALRERLGILAIYVGAQ